MKCCVLSFVTALAPGVQTVTGVIDKTTGQPFVGRVFLFQGGWAQLNEISTSADYTLMQWQYDMSVGSPETPYDSCYGTGTGWAFGSFKDGSGSAGNYAVMDTNPGITGFGAGPRGTGYISDSRSGEFDITWDLKERGGDGRTVTIFGGDDINFDFAAPEHDPIPTTAAPVGVLFLSTQSGSVPPPYSVTTGAGSGFIGWGWDAKDSGRGSATAWSNAPEGGGGGSCGALPTTCIAQVGLNDWVANDAVVAEWGADSYTISGEVGSRWGAIAFSGTDLKCTAGEFTQQADTGQQIVDIGLDAKWVMLASAGIPATSAINLDIAQLVTGWTDGANQGGYWTNESQGQAPQLGARYLSNDTLLRFANAPDLNATVFTAVAELVSVQSDGRVTLNWTTNDGVARRILWFAIGAAVAPVAPVARLTQLPIEAAYGYRLIQPVQAVTGQAWNTPPPIPSRRGR